MPSPANTKLKVRYRLMDVDLVNPLLADETLLDEAISQAVDRYSRDRPREIVEDETGAGSGYFVLVGAGAVLASWVDGFSEILSIDYPAGAISATYAPTWLSLDDDVRYYRDATKTYLYLPNAQPSASETVRITYTARHTHTEVTDTIPTGDLDPLCDLAAHYACLYLATRAAGTSDSTIAADGVNYRDAQLRWKQQAAEWLARYQTALNLSETGDVAGASANADWDQRLESGWNFLTHSPRRR